jgi:hypothetical protein
LTSLHPHVIRSPWKPEQYETEEKESHRGKKSQIGRERPHFFGFQPPKKFVGSLPPSGTVIRAGLFFPGDREFGRKANHRGGAICQSLRKHQES